MHPAEWKGNEVDKRTPAHWQILIPKSLFKKNIYIYIVAGLLHPDPDPEHQRCGRSGRREHAEWKHVVNFQDRVQQLERQLKEMEREKERELDSLRKEKRELIHTARMLRSPRADFSAGHGVIICSRRIVSPLAPDIISVANYKC